MNRNEVWEKVFKVIVEELSCKADEVKPEAVITDDLGADSLDVVEIVMNIESEFDLTISDEDVPNLKTVGDISNYICHRLDIKDEGDQGGKNEQSGTGG